MRARHIILTMVVSFAVSVAIMLWQQRGHAPPLSSSMAMAPAPMSAVAAPSLPAAPVARSEPVLAAATPPNHPSSAAPAPAAAVPPSAEAMEETPAGPLPIAFHIHNRRELNRIEGDIRNTSNKPMSVTLRAVNEAARRSSQIQLELAPFEKKTYSTEDGLDMQSGDQLIAQSPPYDDRVFRVP